MADTDLISRQAVIEINQSYHGQMPNEVNHRIWKEINELPSAQPEPRWIPCSERLPEEGVNVLLCIKDWESQKTKMVVSLRRDYNYWDGLGREIRGDIAWMPLPEPYKEGADE
nr:DUF551 domain-containing protein [uncultured Eubacterium sp.]